MCTCGKVAELSWTPGEPLSFCTCLKLNWNWCFIL
ncbi:hypothetical protein COLO4_33554 [Corchorus olitorius]|uniref:Uncharacterized protein n=1 Tax=Corchorus olitorius TaxID=93759 RepID=A0A1R3GST2_9ROSI|nr:hypothetical protein COLO4_33554 [Corchorus olitorius]